MAFVVEYRMQKRVVAPGEESSCDWRPLLAHVPRLRAGCAVKVQCHQRALGAVYPLVLPALRVAISRRASTASQQSPGLNK